MGISKQIIQILFIKKQYNNAGVATIVRKIIYRKRDCREKMYDEPAVGKK